MSAFRPTRKLRHQSAQQEFDASLGRAVMLSTVLRLLINVPLLKMCQCMQSASQLAYSPSCAAVLSSAVISASLTCCLYFLPFFHYPRRPTFCLFYTPYIVTKPFLTCVYFTSTSHSLLTSLYSVIPCRLMLACGFFLLHSAGLHLLFAFLNK